MFCCYCSAPVDSLSSFCSKCGRALPALAGDTLSSPPSSRGPLESTREYMLLFHVRTFRFSLFQSVQSGHVLMFSISFPCTCSLLHVDIPYSKVSALMCNILDCASMLSDLPSFQQFLESREERETDRRQRGKGRAAPYNQEVEVSVPQ